MWSIINHMQSCYLQVIKLATFFVRIQMKNLSSFQADCIAEIFHRLETHNLQLVQI